MQTQQSSPIGAFPHIVKERMSTPVESLVREHLTRGMRRNLETSVLVEEVIQSAAQQGAQVNRADVIDILEDVQGGVFLARWKEHRARWQLPAAADIPFEEAYSVR